ncbi:MAG: hypothetical protein KJO67_02265 [Silicimonas sp.]|nr:hypothetical protein [Silicimonas sp.]
MRFKGLKELASSGALRAAKGPVAAIIAEDEAEVASTLRHHRDKGFRTLVLFAPTELTLEDETDIIRVDFPTLTPDAAPMIVNALVDALPTKTWLYYGYNAEYLFYPFAEHRSVGEMLTFHTEERRFAMLTYVIDAYAGDLGTADNAVSLQDAWLDRSGYYARARQGDDQPKERQLDFHGGLRWRFEEHIPQHRRRINRIALVRTEPGLRLRSDHTWSDEERNTYACPWHHNLTAAIVSFRTAKALRTNPASRFSIDSFRWEGSLPVEWHSQQLMDLGLMEPGQWF